MEPIWHSYHPLLGNDILTLRIGTRQKNAHCQANGRFLLSGYSFGFRFSTRFYFQNYKTQIEL